MESVRHHELWNKGKLVGQKPPLKQKDIWAIRIHLQLNKRVRELAMFNLAIDSKLRDRDLVKHIASSLQATEIVTRPMAGYRPRRLTPVRLEPPETQT